jgi:predicted DNA-binding transcriptional regulator YafY
MALEKNTRTLEILFRAIRGEDISPSKLAAEYGVSGKSITRSLNEIKEFLAESRDLVGGTELEYSHASKAYRLIFDEFLSDKELFAITKLIIGSRAFSKDEVMLIVDKLKRFAALADRGKLDEIIRREMYHYTAVNHDCRSVIENLWQLIGAITEKKEITISYYKVDRSWSEKRIQPVSLMFTEYYFYLIAYYPGEYKEPRYFRVDRIKSIVEHRKRYNPDLIEDNDEDTEKRYNTWQAPIFDEGELRKRNQFMFFGERRRIRFWYSGPSLQAILDRLPTARTVERKKNAHLVEAEVYGEGIKMFLLSQGAWIHVVEPDDFAKEMAETARAMAKLYEGQ